MKPNRMRRASASLTLLLALAGGAWSESSSVLSIGGSSPALSYNAAGDAEAMGNITITKANGGSDTSSFYVVFKLISLDSSAPSGGDSLSYGLYKSSSDNTPLSLSGEPSGSDEVLSGKFVTENSTAASVSYVFRVSPSTLPAPGTYRATMTATVFRGSYGSSPGSGSSSTIVATATVAELANVAIVGGANDSFSLASNSPHYALALGDLSAGRTGSAYILVRSNSGYGIALASANAGALVNSSDGSSIPYAVRVDNGASRSLTSVAATIVSGAATYSATERHTLVVTIGSPSDNPTEGDYDDTIIVTVSTL